MEQISIFDFTAFGQMFDIDWKAKINELAEELTNERKIKSK